MTSSRREFLKMCGWCWAAASLPFLPSPLAGQELGKSREAEYYQSLGDGRVRCLLCPNACEPADGERGKCRVRGNVGGRYHTFVYGRPCVIAIDPVEKCPLYHFRLPAPAFSIATAGCNLGCHYCQNWQFSQKPPEETRNYELSPEAVVKKALEYKASALSFFYTEPTIYIEYMKETARLARTAGLPCIMVTAGYINPKPLADLLPLIDAFTVGLKGFDPTFYEKYLAGRLDPVLTSLKAIKQSGKHLEVVTLLVPTLNDHPDTVKRGLDWMGENLGREIPLHFTRFHPQFRLKGLPPTPVSTLESARNAALRNGMQHVYTGNIPGHEGNHTFCPKCRKTLVERLGFQVLKEHHRQGRCPDCGQALYGTWK
jgi:pyruvate formate lyase activating enzyme